MMTLTLDKKLDYQHLSVSGTYGSHTLEMKAEVGMYTRNIKMMGEQGSQAERYGSHLLLTGKGVDGLKGHIAYSEFTDCGQPRIIGRYCTHFHMAG